MADLLETAAIWLERQRTRHLTRTVVYGRGAATVALPATIGRTKYEADDGHVVRVEYTDRDYLIPAEDLVLSGSVTEPERGDVVRDDGREFEVLDWRYSDLYRQTLRISTKFIGAVAP